MFNKAQTTLAQFPTGHPGSYIVPVGVTRIGAQAFLDCAQLGGVTIPEGVIRIEQEAFWTDASPELDEPLANGYPFDPLSLWYRWVAHRDGWMTFDTSTPTGLNTMVAAYTDSTLASLVHVAR